MCKLMAAEICFTCLRETPDPIPIADQAESAKVSTTGGTTSYRGVVLAKHFWFDVSEGSSEVDLDDSFLVWNLFSAQ